MGYVVAMKKQEVIQNIQMLGNGYFYEDGHIRLSSKWVKMGLEETVCLKKKIEIAQVLVKWEIWLNQNT